MILPQDCLFDYVKQGFWILKGAESEGELEGEKEGNYKDHVIVHNSSEYHQCAFSLFHHVYGKFVTMNDCRKMLKISRL